MQGSRKGFPLPLLFAALAIIAVPGVALAQDMPPILAPPTVPEVPAKLAPVSPSAEAVIPPAAPVKQEHIAAVDHPTPAHHAAKSATVKKRLAAVHARRTAHHVAVNHVAIREPEPSMPPGSIVPPPGYYGPGPYEHLVYGGPPRGLYGGWGGYRGRYSYYP